MGLVVPGPEGQPASKNCAGSARFVCTPFSYSVVFFKFVVFGMFFKMNRGKQEEQAGWMCGAEGMGCSWHEPCGPCKGAFSSEIPLVMALPGHLSAQQQAGSV